MGLLEVDTAGLGTLAAHSRSLAAELGGTSSPAAAGGSSQATVAVVNATHAGVLVAGRAMSARLHGTAATLAAAGTRYLSGDEQSAAGLSGLVR